MSAIELLKKQTTMTGFKVARIFITGMFCGAILTTMFLWIAAVL